MNICWLYYVTGLRNWQITFLGLIALHLFSHPYGVSTIWYLIHNRWHIFSQNAASVPTGNRGAPDIIRLLPTISVLESKGGKFAAFSKNWLFLLQLLALSPCVGLYFTKAVSHGYLCKAPVSVIVVTRQRNYRGKGKV